VYGTIGDRSLADFWEQDVLGEAKREDARRYKRLAKLSVAYGKSILSEAQTVWERVVLVQAAESGKTPEDVAKVLANDPDTSWTGLKRAKREARSSQGPKDGAKDEATFEGQTVAPTPKESKGTQGEPTAPESGQVSDKARDKATITVSASTKRKLEGLCGDGETVEDVILRLISRRHMPKAQSKRKGHTVHA